MSIIETMIDIPMEHERNVCGQFDAYLKKIERTLHVTMITRDGALKIIGPEQTIRQAKSVFNNLLELSKRGNTVTEQNVDYALPDDKGQAGQTEDDGTETVRGPDPQEDDCIWHRSGGYRKNVSGDVDGDTGI